MKILYLSIVLNFVLLCAANAQCPTVYGVTGGGTVCGMGVPVGLTSSQTGVIYQLKINGANSGSPIEGTPGTPLTWANQTAAGNYTVVGTRISSGCSRTMGGGVSVTTSTEAPPDTYTVSGSGNLCGPPLDATVTLSGSTEGFVYTLMHNGDETISYPGTGSILNWTNIDTPGSYTVKAINNSGGCAAIMSGSVEINFSPQIKSVIEVGNGDGCSVSVQLINSQQGVSYHLKRNGSNSGAAITGTGSSLTWPDQSTPGTYTVTGTIGSSNCSATMNGSVTVSSNGLTVYNVSGSGNLCGASSGPGIVTLSGSQPGIEYSLLLDGNNYSGSRSGTGNTLSWNASDQGVYTISATNPSSGNCSVLMNGNVVIGMGPNLIGVNGGGVVCGSTRVLVKLVSSQTGVNYQLQIDGVNSGALLAGTGSALDWPNQLSAGIYTVIGTNASSGCFRSMSGTATVTDHTPADFTVSGSGSLCAESAGGTLSLSGSQVGVSYRVYRNGSNYMSLQTQPGTGNPISWTGLTSVGTYTVQATWNGCTSQMPGNVVINELPHQYSVFGGGDICNSEATEFVYLNHSETEVSYQLQVNGSNSGAPLAGTGSQLIWGGLSAGGTYTVIGTRSGCSVTMNESVTIIAFPSLFTVGGGGSYCSGNNGLNITLSGSQAGMNYRLRKSAGGVVSTVAGTGSPLTWANQTASGTYTVEAFNVDGGCFRTMTDNATITIVNPLTQYTVTGGGVFCTSGVSVSLNGSQTGVNYQLKINGSNSGSAVAGTNAALTWTNQTAPGTYTVTATHPSAGCTQEMSGNSTVTPLVQHTVGGGGLYCAGGSGVPVSLSGSQTGVSYQLKLGGVNAGAAIPGTGSGLTWTNLTSAGTYTIVATMTSAGCSLSMTSSASVGVKANPLRYTTGGGGSFCPGGNGVPVKLSDSDAGVSYQLQLNGVAIGAPVSGTGNALTWNNQTSVGQYTVAAFDPNTQCSISMLENASVSLHAVPAVYLLSGGGIIPPESSGLQVQLAGSETGVTYQLRLNNNASGSTVSGTGSQLNWSGLTGDGTYTVLATRTSNSCASLMDGSPQVAISMGNSHNVVNNYAFQYKYDARGRMTHKKVPGTGDWIYMVYDNRDRLVLTQDAVQRPTNEWTFTKYDVLDRAVMTGIYTHGAAVTQEYMQASVVNDYYINLGAAKAWYETYTGNTSAHGYDDKSFPAVTGTSVNVLTVTYYDHYTFKTLWGGSAYNYVNDGLSYGGYNQPVSAFGAATDIRGYVTGMVTKVLDGGTTYLRSVSYYDDRYRVIQTVSDNMFSSTDRTSNLYDFTGKILKAKAVHRVGTSAEKITSRRYDYDHAGRMLKMWHQISSNPEVLLAENKYNELGQLVDKKLHSTDGTTFKQSVDFRYNIRGWLTSINNSSLSNNGATNDDSNDLFGMDLGYQNDTGTGNVPKYDGNISSIKWSANQGLSDIEERAYNFAYDPMNRLLSATQVEKNATWTSSPSFHENNLSYDLNGNIQSLTRKGEAGASMDVLTYSYGSGTERSNKLMTVSDGADVTRGFIDGNTTGNDYSYDSNGNMKEDKNKGFAVAYNYINLPEKVTKTSTGEYIKYIYDASGRKRSQRVYNASNVLQKRTDYAAEYFYENDVLKFINHEEGRIIIAGPTYEYQYHLKDHLGNVRLTFTTKEETISETASLEAANAAPEQNQFLRYANARLVQSHLLDITNGIAPSTTTGYAQRLSGGANEKFGLGKSISVMPGDKIRAEVYAKYIDPQSSNWSAALQAVMAQVTTGGNGATVIDGGSYSSSTSAFAFASQGAQNTANSSETGPKAYLNWLVFDRNYNFKLSKSGYDRLSANPKERGQDVAHEQLLSPEIVIDEPGYVYIYLSNEEGTPVDVYFDNFKVEHVKSPVVQSDDYYPFGLTFNSYQRENAVQQNYLYNGKELQDELNLGWMDYGLRMYQPELGRWNGIDPLAEKYFDVSPFVYVANNPTLFIDPNGAEIWLAVTYTNDQGEEVTSQYRYNNGKLYDSDKNEYDGSDAADPILQLMKEQLNATKEEFGENDDIGTMFSFLEGDGSGKHTINFSKGENGIDYFKDKKSEIQFNPLNWEEPDDFDKKDKRERDPRIGLVHELKHAYDHAKGIYKGETDWTYEDNGKVRLFDLYEARAMNMENILRLSLYGRRRETYPVKDEEGNTRRIRAPRRYLTIE